MECTGSVLPNIAVILPNPIPNQPMHVRYASLILAAAALSATAQPTLTSADNLPAIGQVFPYHKAAYAAPPAAGTGMTYNYSGLVETGLTGWQWISPSEYSNPAAFPTAILAATNGVDTLFFTVTTSGLERVGERQSIVGFDAEVPFTDASLNLQLPLSYGQSWSDNIAGNFMVDTSPGVRSGTINGSADGSGLITIPGGEPAAEVVRVYTYTQEVNTLTQVPIFGTVTVIHKRAQYDYYAQFMKTPIVRVYTDSLSSSIGLTQNTSAIEWLDAALVGMAEKAQAADLQVFPNPATDNVNVRLAEPATRNMTVDLCDATGRVILSQRAIPGVQQQVIDLCGIAPGAYMLTLTENGKSIRSARVMRN